MKTKKTDFAQNVLISRDHWDVPVRVRLRPYLKFSQRIDGQLKQLLARWAHAAAPGVQKPGRQGRRGASA